MGAPFRLLVDAAAAVGARARPGGRRAHRRRPDHGQRRHGEQGRQLRPRHRRTARGRAAPRGRARVDGRPRRRPTVPASRSRSAAVRRGDVASAASGRRRAGTRTLNPAFDVTPASLITAIVTDRRVVRLDRGEAPGDPPSRLIGAVRRSPAEALGPTLSQTSGDARHLHGDARQGWIPTAVGRFTHRRCPSTTTCDGTTGPRRDLSPTDATR